MVRHLLTLPFVFAAAVLMALLSPQAIGSTAGAAPVQDRITAATTDATLRGGAVQIAYMDRQTHRYAANSNGTRAVPTASVAKLFIADDMLMRESRGGLRLSDGDRRGIAAMLQSSDDAAADRFWRRFGGGAMVAEVINRYHLGDARASGAWFDTRVSPADMVHYYDQLIGGTSGLPNPARDFILDRLRASTPFAADGYDQRFGLSAGLNREPVRAIKQGWMMASNGDHVHNSTAVLGPDGRYIVVVFTQEPRRLGARHARETINRVANILFPAGTAAEAPDNPFDSLNTLSSAR